MAENISGNLGISWTMSVFKHSDNMKPKRGPFDFSASKYTGLSGGILDF